MSGPSGGSSGNPGTAPAMQSAPSGSQYFSLRWNNHPSNLVSVFSGLFTSETLVDVTLAAEGKHIQAHKMLLSACSDYFQSLFSINPCRHPIVILKDVKFDDLQTVVQFMYNGVVNVSSEKLPAVLKTADTLQIKGLGEKFSESMNQYMGSSYSSSPRLLSVPSQHSVNSRQLSTESLPEYLHRTRSFSPRQTSTDSRQYSIESSVSALVRKQPTPPSSPPRHYRKKFRKMSAEGSSSERGNSLEDERSSSHANIARTSPPTIHLSPSRQSSSSTDPEGPMIVAKKKRELFSNRSSRSGGSNKSSSEYSREHSFKPLDSSGSSGQSHSISQSQEDPCAGAISTTSTPSSLAVPGSIGGGAGGGVGVIRTLTRTQSAGEQQSSSSVDSQNCPRKRSRFLKRQDCLEKGMDLTTDTVAADSDNNNLNVTPTTIKSSPNSPLTSSSPYASIGSPQDSKLLSPLPPPMPELPHPPLHQTLMKQKSQPLNDNLLSPYYNIDATPINPPLQPPSAHKLPYVRVIPDAEVDPLMLEHHHQQRIMPIPNMRLLCPPDFSDRGRSPVQKSLRTTQEVNSSSLPLSSSATPSSSPVFIEKSSRGPTPASKTTTMTSASSSMNQYDPFGSGGGGNIGPPTTSSNHTNVSHQQDAVDVMPLPPHQVTDQFGHCPKAREGPALGCNFCWNTNDANGRILRRKTKYHCPECQANLCIVPCFQQYHEALDRERERELSPHHNN